ncbi:MAG: hypothetical protein L0Y66_20190 [Myxococcaceae bacterium]|nr:hypothetical protein [Myxococcaceae bacterium]MCI0673938.1 hypothetical protein [Myxococcaceae bacterium]
MGALLALGCGAHTTPPQEGAQPLGGAEDRSYRDAYGPYADEVREALASGRCKVDKKCGDLAFVNCGIEADGLGYYVDTRSGAVLEVCGGACWARREGFCVACPPPEWTCGE